MKVAAKTPAKAKVPTKTKTVAKTKAPVKVKAPAKTAVKTPAKAKTPAKKTAKKPAPKAILPASKPVEEVAVPAPAVSAPATPAATPKAPARPARTRKPHFNKGDLEQFKAELLAMRDRITGQSGALRHAALQRHDEVNPEEDGTDAFMRLQTLEQVGTQHRDIANIDDALRSIEKGTYGICDMCGERISKPRLAVLPFATNCVKCQSEMERRMPRRGRRR